MNSHRSAADRAPSIQTRGVRLAISMSEMVIGPPRSIPSLVKGEGDDSFTLIWSRRNGD